VRSPSGSACPDPDAARVNARVGVADVRGVVSALREAAADVSPNNTWIDGEVSGLAVVPTRPVATIASRLHGGACRGSV